MIELKRCSKCKKEKGTSHFSTNRRAKDGLFGHRKPCSVKTAQKAHAKNVNKPCSICGGDKEGLKHSYCRPCLNISLAANKYGISIEEAKELRAVDNCEACGRSTEEAGAERGLFIDHCHDGGHVRGVLCHYCNIALGMLRDDPVRILKLGMYLNRVTYDESNTPSPH